MHRSPPEPKPSVPDPEAPLKYRWLDMVFSPQGPALPNARYVLLYLGSKMRADGSSCFPSTRTIAEATCLSRRTVEEHIRQARADGWLIVSDHGNGKGWRRFSYSPGFPAKVGKPLPQEGAEGGAMVSPGPKEGGEMVTPPNAPQTGSPNSPDVSLGGATTAHGGATVAAMVGQPLPLSSSMKSPVKSPEKKRKTSSQLPVAGEPPTREDVVEEGELGRWLPLARENICYIHGGTERPVRIGDHLVGVGIEINRFKALVQEQDRDPELVARAIRHIPTVTGLNPPVSLARWGDEDDGWAILSQCEGLALKEMEGTR